MKTVIVDTGYWIELFNPGSNTEHQEIVELISNLIHDYRVLIPYPTLYELLNSKFSRNPLTRNFKDELSKTRYVKIDDSKYRDRALNKFLEKNQYVSREDISFVDEVIREMIDDVNLRTDFIITFDKALENYALSKSVRTI